MFLIRDSKGLQTVVYGIQRGLGMDVFPVDLIYRAWKHAEGQVCEGLCVMKLDISPLWYFLPCSLSQLSFIQYSLMNPDIFCFADYPCHAVATDILKAPPEDDNREIATW